jgi:ADP-heptose:LPS heptosyltransferase
MDKFIRQKEKILNRANGQKTALLIRYGAIGDLVMATPVLRQLKKDGYYVVMNMHSNSVALVGNPNIDATIKQKQDEVPNKKLAYYWKKLGYGFDKVINLSESIEGTLLKMEGRHDFHLPIEDRRKTCNINYMDQTMKWAGYDNKGELPELFFTKDEHRWAKKFRKKYEDKFIILISLSGSGIHKVYPYMENVITQFLENYPDAIAVTIGDMICKILEWDHSRTLSWSGNLPLRKSLILTKYADLVIGTETGILNAASCFDTPKIVFLSHSTKENLTKYWKNCEAIEPNVKCYPCHQLHYSKKTCVLNSKTDSPICMTMIRPEQVLIRIEKFYKESRRKAA